MIDAAGEVATSASVPVRITTGDDGAEEAVWRLATEMPVQITVNDEPFAVMLATPADLTDLAVGLLLTAEILDSASAIRDVSTAVALGEAHVSVVASGDGAHTDRVGRRAGPGNSGCGLCGVETLAQLQTRRAPALSPRVGVSDEAVRRAFDQLPRRQPLNADTRSVHAAAWCSPAGDVVLVREDVGRHNALDKLVGALSRAQRLEEPGFIVMSSRGSYELVAKASFTQASLLATISAPTTMALQWAQALDLPIASTVRRDGTLGIVRFPHNDRGSVFPPSS